MSVVANNVNGGGSSTKDTLLTKIFVGGLPYQTSDESLRDFFCQFGEIDEAVVIMDRVTGKSKGYGFVTMADKDAATRACQDPNPIIDSRKANVNLAYLGVKPRAIPGYNIPGMPPMMPAGGMMGAGGAAQHGYLPGGMTNQVQYVLTPSGYMAVLPGNMAAAAPATNPALLANQSAMMAANLNAQTYLGQTANMNGNFYGNNMNGLNNAGLVNMNGLRSSVSPDLTITTDGELASSVNSGMSSLSAQAIQQAQIQKYMQTLQAQQSLQQQQQLQYLLPTAPLQGAAKQQQLTPTSVGAAAGAYYTYGRADTGDRTQ